MIKNNSVIFKGRKDGIIISLAENVDFSTIKRVLQEKTIDAQQFFGNTKTTITFQGRQLNDEEEQELLDVLSQSSNLNISFSSKEQAKHTIVASPTQTKEDVSLVSDVLPVLSETNNPSYFYQGSLRSGQSIRYAGSVVVIGDINPGAEIVAEGNVVVMGNIRGMVYAGCSGNVNCIVSALNLQPTQLRIADTITYIPPEVAKEQKKNKFNPVYAYIQDGQIYISEI